MNNKYPLDMDGYNIKNILHTIPNRVSVLESNVSSKPNRSEIYLKSDGELYIKPEIDEKFNNYNNSIALINQSLYDLHAIKNGSITIKIAAYNASEKTKAAADYICSGVIDGIGIGSPVGDEVVIMQAISDLGAIGGCIELSEGTFVLGGNLIIPNIPLLIKGQGNATKFESEVGGRLDLNGCVKGTVFQDMHIHSSAGTIRLEGCSNILFRNMKVYGQYEGIYSIGSDIIIDSCNLSSSYDYENYMYLALTQINGTASISNSFVETMGLTLTENLTPYSPIGIVYSCMMGCMVYFLIKNYNDNTNFTIPYTDNCWIANEVIL